MASILFLLCVYTNLYLCLFIYLFIYYLKTFTVLIKIKVPTYSSFLPQPSFSHCSAAASLSTSLLGFHAQQFLCVILDNMV